MIETPATVRMVMRVAAAVKDVDHEHSEQNRGVEHGGADHEREAADLELKRQRR